MNNERIDFSELEDLQESWEERLTEEGIKEALGNWLFDNGNELIAELKRCYEREDMIIRALKDAWIGNTCWHQPSENLEDIAETRGSILGAIASLLSVDVNRQDIHDFDNGCGGENCDHDASE